MKNEIKRILNMLDDEVRDILEKLDLNLIDLKLRFKFCDKPYEFKKEKELRLSAKEKINKIEESKKEVENNEDKLAGEIKVYK